MEAPFVNSLSPELKLVVSGFNELLVTGEFTFNPLLTLETVGDVTVLISLVVPGIVLIAELGDSGWPSVDIELLDSSVKGEFVLGTFKLVVNPSLFRNAVVI